MGRKGEQVFNGKFWRNLKRKKRKEKISIWPVSLKNSKQKKREEGLYP